MKATILFTNSNPESGDFHGSQDFFHLAAARVFCASYKSTDTKYLCIDHPMLDDLEVYENKHYKDSEFDERAHFL